jgi:ATP-binding cassette subfamily B protein
MAESVENLKDFSNPVILHVTIENILSHYVVFYGFKSNQAIIGDPAKGVIDLFLRMKLNDIWKSKTITNLIPNPTFFKKRKNQFEKKRWIAELIKMTFIFYLYALFLVS